MSSADRCCRFFLLFHSYFISLLLFDTGLRCCLWSRPHIMRQQIETERNPAHRPQRTISLLLSLFPCLLPVSFFPIFIAIITLPLFVFFPVFHQPASCHLCVSCAFSPLRLHRRPGQRHGFVVWDSMPCQQKMNAPRPLQLRARRQPLPRRHIPSYCRNTH